MKKTIKSRPIKSKCSQTFCKKVLKKTSKRISDTMRTTRITLEKRQKVLKQQIGVAERNGNTSEMEKLSNEHVFNYGLIEELKNIKIEELIMKLCNKFYCNPGCKDMLTIQKGDFNDKLPKEFITDLRKNGATSACILQKPLEDIF